MLHIETDTLSATPYNYDTFTTDSHEASLRKIKNKRTPTVGKSWYRQLDDVIFLKFIL